MAPGSEGNKLIPDFFCYANFAQVGQEIAEGTVFEKYSS